MTISACLSSHLGDENLVVIEQASETTADQSLGFRHYPANQVRDVRYVVDQTDDHAAAPGARIHVALDHHFGVDASNLIMDIRDLQASAPLALDLK
jgi:hypothetical protein